jgi:hypothetical protein
MSCKEATSNAFGYDDGTVLILGIAASFNIPVLNRSDDMGLIGRPKLKL